MFIEKVNAEADFIGSSSDLDNSILWWGELDMWDFLLTAISVFVLLAWVFSIIFILWWGLLLILSWGKDDKIKPAINTIRYAVIGVVVTVLTIFVFPIFGRLLWLDVDKYANPEAIFKRIDRIWNKIFWNETTFKESKKLDDFPKDFSDL